MRFKHFIRLWVCAGVAFLAAGAGGDEKPQEARKPAGRPFFACVDAAVINYSALQPGQQTVAAIVLTIDPKFHAQSNTPSGKTFEESDPEAKAYVTFKATLDANDAFSTYPGIYPEGKSELLKVDPKPLNVYEGTITFYLPFQVKPDVKPGPIKLTGKVHYQACNDHVRFQPMDMLFSIETSIVAVDQPVKKANGAVFEGLDPKLLPHASVPAAPQVGGSSNQPYAWTPYTADALESARKEKRVVVVVFTAAWCASCKNLEIHTLQNPDVVAAVKKWNVKMVRADLTTTESDAWALLKQLAAEKAAVPLAAVYTPGVAEPAQLAGIFTPEELIGAIERATRAANQRQ